MRTKKYNIITDSTEIVKIFVNKQLEKYGKTYEDVIKKPTYKTKGETISWFEKYTFDTEQEYESWKNFCVNFLTKNITPKLTKDRINKEFCWFNLGFGLKHNWK